MKKIFYIITMCLLFVVNANAQWYSGFNNDWLTKNEAGMNRWFYWVDSLSTTLVIGSSATDTIKFLPTIIYYDSLGNFREASWVADDGEITLPTGYAGEGTIAISVNDTVHLGQITFNADGSIINIITSSGDIANTDTDGYLVIYDVGAGVAVKNRKGIGARVKINIDLWIP